MRNFEVTFEDRIKKYIVKLTVRNSLIINGTNVFFPTDFYIYIYISI